MVSNKWRTSEDAHVQTARIGPNAILQLLPVIRATYGAGADEALMARAGVHLIPDGSHMIPEGHAARLHRQMRQDDPDRAPLLAAQAGRGTADYILANRIPAFAQWLLKHMPAALAARQLSRAINAHAWTFAGSGRFTVIDPWTFRIVDNPLIRGEHSRHCLCHWHAAVFERLYQVLVARDCECREITCGARAGDTACTFAVTRVR